MVYKKYDVVLVDFGQPDGSSEQCGVRPAIVCQNDIGNAFSSTTIVMPFTTKLKNLRQPTHSLFKADKSIGLEQDSMLLGECVRQISESKIMRRLGTITKEVDKSEIKRVYLANWEV